MATKISLSDYRTQRNWWLNQLLILRARLRVHGSGINPRLVKSERRFFQRKLVEIRHATRK